METQTHSRYIVLSGNLAEQTGSHPVCSVAPTDNADAPEHPMKFNLPKLSAGLVLALAAVHVWSAPMVVAQSSPLLSELRGDLADVQVDPALSVTFAGGTYTGYKVTRIEWWGFGLPSTSNPTSFTLALNANDVLVDDEVTGTAEPTFQGSETLFAYGVDASALNLFVLSNNTLRLGNSDQGGSMNWFWQDGLGQQPHAFRVYGEAVTQVPEPGSALLVALAGFGLMATRRRAA
jgi:hypothetical protein